MCNLKEYSSNYFGPIGSLGFSSNNGASNFNVDIANDNNFKYFEYKTKLLGNTEAQPNPNHTNGTLKNTTIAVPL